VTTLSEALQSGKFIITCELNPPKGTNLEPLFRRADMLKGRVDGFNLTDSHAARMAMTPLAVAHLLLDRGAEPIVQMTTRDRNRIALQADLLGAHALGVHNVVFMGGDPPTTGDHPEAKPVFDVFSSLMLRAARRLEQGEDMAGNPVNGTPRFCLGAVVNPGARDLDGELERMGEKIEAGARFFQSQAVYEPSTYERFAERAQAFDAPVLAGIIPLKSPDQARYMNEHIPGIHVPEALIRDLAEASDPRQKSIEIASRTIAALRPMCQGLHIMAIGWEEHIPAILERSTFPQSSRAPESSPRRAGTPFPTRQG